MICLENRIDCSGPLSPAGQSPCHECTEVFLRMVKAKDPVALKLDKELDAKASGMFVAGLVQFAMNGFRHEA